MASHHLLILSPRCSRSNIPTSSNLVRPSKAVPSRDESDSTMLFGYGLSVVVAAGTSLSTTYAWSFVIRGVESGTDLPMRARASLALRLRPHGTPALWHKSQSSPGTR